MPSCSGSGKHSTHLVTGSTLGHRQHHTLLKLLPSACPAHPSAARLSCLPCPSLTPPYLVVGTGPVVIVQNHALRLKGGSRCRSRVGTCAVQRVAALRSSSAGHHTAQRRPSSALQQTSATISRGSTFTHQLLVLRHVHRELEGFVPARVLGGGLDGRLPLHAVAHKQPGRWGSEERGGGGWIKCMMGASGLAGKGVQPAVGQAAFSAVLSAALSTYSTKGELLVKKSMRGTCETHQQSTHGALDGFWVFIRHVQPAGGHGPAAVSCQLAQQRL